MAEKKRKSWTVNLPKNKGWYLIQFEDIYPNGQTYTSFETEYFETASCIEDYFLNMNQRTFEDGCIISSIVAWKHFTPYKKNKEIN